MMISEKCTCQVVEESVVNIFHEYLPPGVNKVDDMWVFFSFGLNAACRSVIAQRPRLHGTDEMRHFCRATKPLTHPNTHAHT